MYELLLDMINWTIEYREWSVPMAISSIGSIGTTIWVSIGLIAQNKKIWKSRSGEGLEVLWFAYFTSIFASAALYGFYLHSVGIILNTLAFMVLHIPIMLGLWRFKIWTRIEKILAPIFLLSLPIGMVLIPDKDATFLMYSIGMICSASIQPWGMWREKQAGVLSLGYVVSQIASVVFWSIFAFYTNALALMILNPALFIVFSVTVFLWYFYRAQERLEKKPAE